ncbi:MAG TPA: DUF2312 domain-containing protein [Tabrizicola sp.]|nr:DUF2312 domain-containing protein [Tabrizicola sp.]
MDGSSGIDTAAEVSAAELRQFVERIEASRARQADEKEVEKEIFAELKGRGYMSRPVRTVIKERAMKPDALAEEQAVLEMYRAALGMG